MVKRILIVDDHASIRASLRRLLESQPGYEVCGDAENGLEGIEKARKLRPDLVVLDLSMPVLNGFQAARVMRSSTPGLLIIMYTSHTSANLVAEALEIGVSAVVSKVGPPQVLLTTIRTLLEAAA
jgi:DNA-binding NarL/FixJ family response regulator